MITPFAVAQAYAATQNALGAETSTATAPSAGGFADILKSAITDAMTASKHAETQIAAQVQGKADLIDVVTAVSSAETSLEMVMAIRDQVISAYQEISRMPI